ncbi:MAG: hypothetical protein IT423_06960 [Pirellulaceae bacterium]|nr:hypothetical protein [Pirellulaceae bacterium]
MENTPSTLADAKSRIADLERQLVAAVTTAQVYELRVAKMKATFSWKLTAPFRERSRAVTRISDGGKNFRLRAWFDRLAWKKFFRVAERQFRLARRSAWPKHEKPLPSVKPASVRGLKIHADLQSAIARQRKAA